MGVGGSGGGEGDAASFAQQGAFRIKKEQKQRQKQPLSRGHSSIGGSVVRGAGDADDAAKDEDEELMEDTGVQGQKNCEIADLDEYLDLVQVLAVLLIPMLARCSSACSTSSTNGESVAAADSSSAPYYSPLSPQPSNLLQEFVHILLDEYIRTNNDSNILEPVLSCIANEEFVTNILMQVGELERAKDVSLIREMVAAAAASTTALSASSATLSSQAMYMALTGDIIDVWNVGSEDDESTLIQDAYGDEDITKNPTIENAIVEEKEDEKEEEEEDIAAPQAKLLPRISTMLLLLTMSMAKKTNATTFPTRLLLPLHKGVETHLNTMTFPTVLLSEKACSRGSISRSQQRQKQRRNQKNGQEEEEKCYRPSTTTSTACQPQSYDC